MNSTEQLKTAMQLVKAANLEALQNSIGGHAGGFMDWLKGLSATVKPGMDAAKGVGSSLLGGLAGAGKMMGQGLAGGIAMGLPVLNKMPGISPYMGQKLGPLFAGRIGRMQENLAKGVDAYKVKGF
jgi:hypothetical protein